MYRIDEKQEETHKNAKTHEPSETALKAIYATFSPVVITNTQVLILTACRRGAGLILLTPNRSIRIIRSRIRLVLMRLTMDDDRLFDDRFLQLLDFDTEFLLPLLRFKELDFLLDFLEFFAHSFSINDY